MSREAANELRRGAFPSLPSRGGRARLRRFGGFATFIDAAATPPWQGGENAGLIPSWAKGLTTPGHPL